MPACGNTGKARLVGDRILRDHHDRRKRRAAPIHDRMPVILHEQDYDHWLDPKCDAPSKLGELLKPYPPEEMTAFPVSTFVNSPRNESSECIAPVAAQ